jgi:hypothetical protein
MKSDRFNCEEIAIADKRKAYEEKFDAQFKEWSAKIALLNTNADKAEVEAKITDIY